MDIKYKIFLALFAVKENKPPRSPRIAKEDKVN
jgi:hypothetical protein